MKSSLAEQLYGRKVINTINKEVFVPNKDVSKIAMDAYNNFYGNLTDESEKFCKDIWSKYPFSIFDPKTPFFKHKKSSQAIETRDLSFFIRGTQAAFFPDKSEDEVLEAKRLAMNRGISSLNLLCKSNLPEYSNFFEIPKIHSPFNPMEIMSNAKEKWKIARQGMHRYSKHPELMYEAFNVARSWGWGILF